MGPDLGLLELIRWFTVTFPSTAEYTSIMMPMIIFGFSIVNIFSNILPTPGDKYQVPELDDIETELDGVHSVLRVLAKMSRRLTILANRVVGSRVYVWFYNATKLCAKILRRLKGGTDGESKPITKPKPFKFIEKIKRHNDND
jgi:hypothetical protein